MHSRRPPERHLTRPGALFPHGAHARAALRGSGVLTAIGLLGLIPALVLVVTGIAGAAPPRPVVHPVLVLGGLAAALGASVVAVTHWDVVRARDQVQVSCTFRRRPVDLAILAGALLLLGIILVYSFLENYQPR